MVDDTSTRWSMVRRAADGVPTDQSDFVAVYESAVRAYLRARWHGTSNAARVDDAAQDVFVDCFREGGALLRADPTRPGGFRAFLYGVVRIVALRHEREAARNGRCAPAATGPPLDAVPGDDPGLSTAFDRAWAQSLIREAAVRHRDRAAEAGPSAVRRVELLRLRFQDDVPIREIARRWDEDPARLHHEYARAREEFRSALFEVVAADHPGSPEEVEAEARRLLAILG